MLAGLKVSGFSYLKCTGFPLLLQCSEGHAGQQQFQRRITLLVGLRPALGASTVSCSHHVVRVRKVVRVCLVSCGAESSAARAQYRTRGSFVFSIILRLAYSRI